MKKNILIVLSVLALGLALTACNKNEMPDKPGGEHNMEAAKYACPMHPEVTDTKPGKCSKCGMPLKSMSSGHGHTAEPVTKAEVVTLSPLQIGQKTEAIIRLTKKDGSPVLLSDLQEAHTKKIHLLIIDPSLSDYHHEHPQPTPTPGEYSFSFTPRKPGAYRAWADLLPAATGEQEYAMTDIAADSQGEPISERDATFVAEVEGLKYQIAFDKAKLVAGQPAKGKLRITSPDGKIFDQLEPIMGTYAHLVGFGEDYKSIVHIHPMGVEPKSEAERGAGSLEFHIQPEKPGLMRLYAQVQIGGVSKFAKFTLQVVPNN